MEFKPDYLGGILNAVGMTLLLVILSMYLSAKGALVVVIATIGFFVVLVAGNKKWIKKVTLDFDKELISLEYPFNLFGPKHRQILFSDIDNVTYFRYMYRTPAHFRITYSGKKLRFRCRGKDSKIVSKKLEVAGIQTDFYHEKEVKYR